MYCCYVFQTRTTLNISHAYFDFHVLYLVRRGLTIDTVREIRLIDLIGLMQKGNSTMMTQCVRLICMRISRQTNEYSTVTMESTTIDLL